VQRRTHGDRARAALPPPLTDTATMNRFVDLSHALVERLEGLGEWLAPLGLRLILAWEFWEAGREKYSGSNWFMDIQGSFPFPFNVVPCSAICSKAMRSPTAATATTSCR
jgi:hypothetical protein